MKVFQVNTVYNSGSTGRIAADIKHALEKEGHECFVAYGRGNSNEFNTECVSNKFDLYYHALMTRLTDRTGFYSKKATKRMICKIKEFAPDIIHLHNIHGYYVNIEMLFKFLAEYNRPVVWTLHDCWSFTGHCSHFEYEGCYQWKTQCRNCVSTNQYPSSWKDDCQWNYIRKKELFTSVENMTIITPSHWLASLVKDSFLGKYPVRVINNGINIDIFKPSPGHTRERYNLGTKKIILGVANVWNGKKGLNDFIELAKHIDDETSIILVGLTKKQIATLPSNIIGVERTETIRELVELYSDSDVFLNLTYEDTYPTVNLEALACGTRVITYKTGGSPESAFIRDEEAVEKGDYISAYDRIKNIQHENGWFDVNQISLEHMKLKYLNLYSEIWK